MNGLNRKSGNSRFLSVFTPEADIVCLQETKYPQSEIHAEYKSPAGYRKDFSPITRTLEAGIALYARRDFAPPRYGTGASLPDDRSRIQATDFGSFILVNCFFPDGVGRETPMHAKLAFADACIKYLGELRAKDLPAIVCGDFSIAPAELDIFPAERKSIAPGISPAERARLDGILDLGFTDAFRYCHPTAREYTWWPAGNASREQDLGARYDYFFVSNELVNGNMQSVVLPRNDFSDHAPIQLDIEVPERC